jgi:hypothetical protein
LKFIKRKKSRKEERSWALDALRAAPDLGTPPGGLIDAGAPGRGHAAAGDYIGLCGLCSLAAHVHPASRGANLDAGLWEG